MARGKQAVCDGDGLKDSLAAVFKKRLSSPTCIEYTTELDDPVNGDALLEHKRLINDIRKVTSGVDVVGGET
eukprot:3365098-Pyramimonas_sp.AAC.1